MTLFNIFYIFILPLVIIKVVDIAISMFILGLEYMDRKSGEKRKKEYLKRLKEMEDYYANL